jgi:acyl carrier protein
MTPSDILPAIRLAYQRVTGQRPDSLSAESDLQALGVDSVQLLEVIVIVERELGLRVPNSALGRLDTIGDLCDVLDDAFQPVPDQAGR